MKFLILVDPSSVIIPVYLLCLFYAWEKKRRFLKLNNAISQIWLIWPCPSKEPLPQGSWNLPFILVDPSLVFIPIYMYLVCLYYEKKIFKEIIHFHCMTDMAMLLHKNPCSGGHEFYNFGRPFIGHHYYTLIVCIDHAPK